MIPTEYRLECVAARLIERLDGARRSFDDEPSLREGARRMAEEHLDAAAAEWTELGFADHPERHAAFLRAEVLQTFLPRFVRVAARKNVEDEGGYGLGPLARPLGRVVLVAATLLLIWYELRFARIPMVWPLMLLTLGLPALPDLVAWASQRRYRGELKSILGDLGRIQDQALTYQPSALPLGETAPPEPATPVTRPPRGRESE